ncbi:hypothetical protein QBC36DRAFT_378539 [Triangularia setosa]|uniref:Major facilitator superfamily (MFS) profile domain-containing protein n=1 Tax=Triangularia setosa TaxID=2587417 RepID=A0AAN6WA87_9PEZI|nr:hypothetical protein QBC36DRAFT_378539 [Podospora setosa]
MEEKSLSHRRLPSDPEADKFPGPSTVVTSSDASSSPSNEFIITKTMEPEYVEGFKLVTLLASVTVVVFLMVLDTSILATAIPRITDEFKSLEDVGWYASIYQLASAALQPLTGKIYQKFSSQWAFITFFAIFEIGSAICGASVASWMLITGRAIAGIGGAVIAGPLVQKTGYVIPYTILSSIIGAVSNGFYSTFSPTTPLVQYILYQILGGIGRGAGMQMPLLADIAMGTCILVFFQNLGISILLAAANTIFGDNLQSKLTKVVPYSKEILDAGATRFRGVVREEDLLVVLEAWSRSIDKVFYMAAAAGGVAVFAALGMGWVDIRKQDGGKKKRQTEGDPEDNS